MASSVNTDFWVEFFQLLEARPEFLLSSGEVSSSSFSNILATVKRKRGRPRRDDQQVGDFDVSLIREFSNRPAFYDRTCVNYRNREYLDTQWEEMAQQLGYEVGLLKERMLQLRNRYNLEKRRIETTQHQYPKKFVKSQWPLYDYLTFLSDHIKARRSFRTMPAKQTNSRYHNDDYDIKNENGSDLDSDADYQDEDEYKEPQDFLNGETSDANNMPSNSFNQIPSQVNRCQMTNEECLKQMESQLKNQRTDNGAEKFKAFGRFLTSSLIEMSERDALVLIEKFTSQLVQSLLSEDKTTKNEDHAFHTNGASNSENNLFASDCSKSPFVHKP